ncbi:MAG: phage integrase SAM-like domain-containing protein, partial [Chitinophagaceae bacterium]|nr:phage integrase SAM-like domain-containing protein [Chitinophagaceae bacterium]
MSVTFSIVLDKRRIISKTENYPVKLRVTYQRKSKEYKTIHKLTVGDFNKIEAPRISESLQRVKDDFKEIESMMALAVKKVFPFDFWVFNRDYIAPSKLFVKKKSKKPLPVSADTAADTFDYSEYEKLFPIIKESHDEIGRISGVYCDYIKQLIREKRIGSATKYRDSYSVIKSFGGNMYFQHITVEWLRSFEGWMIGKGRSRATVGGILRHLRCIFNEANHKKIINKEMCYPFGQRKYQI